MCDLCGEDKERGKKNAIAFAEDLERLAGYQRSLARGIIKPHSEDVKSVSDLAHLVLRKIVEDYV